MKKYLVILLALFTLTGCVPTSDNSSSQTSATQVTETSVVVEQPAPYTTESTTSTADSTDSTIVASGNYTDFSNLQKDFSIIESTNWTADCGAYVEVNNNKPLFDNITSEVFENYSDLDSLGRCGVAFANVCTELQPTEKRGNIGMIKPSGWKTSNYNEHPGLVDGNYLYNRCHLIGYQLAGENANEKNLITGTRYLNVTGMLPFENMVDDYLEENPKNHVLYRVTPSYINNDLVAQGVLMEAYSVEDNGKLQFCIWCYNVQPSITIDYSTGDNWLSTETPSIESTTNNSSTNEEFTYILNTNSKKIHRPNCSAVNDMKAQNKEETHKSIEELESEGYAPCEICKPQE